MKERAMLVVQKKVNMDGVDMCDQYMVMGTGFTNVTHFLSGTRRQP